jgi:hypothetical protein
MSKSIDYVDFKSDLYQLNFTKVYFAKYQNIK